MRAQCLYNMCMMGARRAGAVRRARMRKYRAEISNLKVQKRSVVRE